MKNWLVQHWIAFKRTLAGMVRHPLTAGLNLLVIGIAAALPLTLWLIVASVAAVTAHMPVTPQLTVFLKSNTAPAMQTEIREQLAHDTRIAQSRFVAKEEALKQMQAATGVADLLAGLSENPLPDAFVITAKDNRAEALEALQQELKGRPGIEETQLDSAWARRLERLVALARMLFNVLAVLLGTSLALITGNAIRMQILTRQDEIEVVKLIGATDSFIRRPFIHFALAEGLLGGVLACVISAIIIAALNPAVSELALAYNQQFSLQMPGPIEAGVVVFTTTLLCLLGAWIAVWQHLRKFL
jgi:cell division transport system permease protein